MPQERPVTTPTISPSISPEVEANPEKLCEPQKEKLTREIAPLLP